MKRLVKKLVAIFCLVSIGLCFKGNIMSMKDLSSIGYSVNVLTARELDSLNKPQNNPGLIVIPDWKKAPNSYYFDPAQSSDGLFIPVRKAYAMWEGDSYIKGNGIPGGTVTADVLWEDVHGLIKSGAAYALEISGSGQDAKIKVPVNKTKKGNAVIAFRVNGEIYWSWHVWVTDDPSNGSSYKSFENLQRLRSDGSVELIPDFEWKWMDRNLGALTSSITASDWNRSNGLLYQWGRKDPIPPLVTRGNDFYEASGSIGRVRHRAAKNFTNALSIDDLTKVVLLSAAEVTNNIRLSVKNPLSLIYINKNDNSGQAYYSNNVNLPVNWFGRTSDLPDNRLSELNLWSDNSQGKIAEGYNNDSSAKPYRDKSPYDPCPNGWRIPSMLVANLGSSSYIDDIRVDFSPFGVKTNIGKNAFEANKYHIIKPTDAGVPVFMTGFKIYPNWGFDLSSVNGYDMGVFPGTGQLIRNAHLGQYSDQHHTALWTATMTRHFDTSPSVSVRGLTMIPDKGQPDVPDPGYPNIRGRYFYMPMSGMYTSDANGCRCIKDPLYKVNDYDFPTEYIPAAVPDYKEGINNPNTYLATKSTQPYTVEIPVSKAFSVQSQVLNNPNILISSSFNNLKANVLWTTNVNLISSVSIVNPSPSTLQDIRFSRISVEIRPNQSGNAVITLHNGSITNPVYWSWHIWITNTPVVSYAYTTELPVKEAVNYVNYVNKADIVLMTEFLDRNIGALSAFPNVENPLTPTAAELSEIRASTGLHYQWGRKDPIPTFQYADNRASFNVFLGKVHDNGSISYTTLSAATYNNLSAGYIVPYDTYAPASGIQGIDKPIDKVNKIISYSVQNPLAFMIPSTFSPFNSSSPNYTNGTDWVANEPNLAPERWGRGGGKSPFDPCPEGWRIPDLTSVALVSGQDFGQTPWYKKDKNIATSYSIVTDYKGIRVRNPSTTSTIGYQFLDNTYSIGNYPDSGSRAFRNVVGNQSPQGTFNVVNFQYAGIWTDALASNYLGRAVNVLFDAASAANRLIAFHDNNDPYFGMGCRCVRIKYNAFGKEEGPASKFVITALRNGIGSPVGFSTIELKTETRHISVFPNPFKDILYLKESENKDYTYEVFDVSGRLVKSGTFENKQTDLSSLVPGGYLIRINNSEAVVKIIKR